MSLVIMLVCLVALDYIKEQDFYKKLETFIYALGGSVLLICVIGLLAIMLVSNRILPPLRSLLPKFLVEPLFITAYYVFFLVCLDIVGFDLRGAAQAIVSLGSAYAPAVVVIAALGIVIFGAFR